MFLFLAVRCSEPVPVDLSFFGFTDNALVCKDTVCGNMCIFWHVSKKGFVFSSSPKRICWWRFRPLIIISDILGTPMTYIPMQIVCKYTAYQFHKFEKGLASHSRTNWLAEISVSESHRRLKTLNILSLVTLILMFHKCIFCVFF